ncbi:helix-turn-helix transcriptional regulator [Methanosarcina barkeri]|uniref:ArsR family transcriptional regulator n=1 Tax=Methanosarcina barkeri CM1 TaxID=796385 RepID=A0A0G3CKP2_METBA|nr:winged helix-turn-helix domain-containing protein [Methanosarcina barkeri]AKJ39667.1 ArsR family transcriptional regulator [Methanosarcina barkeri CM1]
MSSSLCDTIWLSEKRKNLLLLLMEGPRDIEQIKTSLNVTSKAMMPQIKILQKQGLVIQKENTYMLSEIGKLVVGNMLPLLNTLEVLEENKEYWTSRDTSVIPQEQFMRLGELGECMVIEPDLNHLFDLPREFTENLIKSRCIMSSLSYYHPLYSSLYSRLAKSGAEMEIVLTKAVLERLKNDCRDELETLLDSESTVVKICEENLNLPTIAVTEKFMYICLFNKQGKYDHRKVMSFDASALRWGRELFMHYNELSQEVIEI